MNVTAKKYINLFRQVKSAAATADAQGHPRARIAADRLRP